MFAKFTGDFFPSNYCIQFCISRFLFVCLFKDKKNVSEIFPEEQQQIFVKRKMLSFKCFFSTGAENTHSRKARNI